MRDNKFLEAISILVGTVIGAGILGIPKAISEVGFWIGSLYIFGLGFVILILNLYVGEISLRTKKTHELTGYAEKYLGKKAKTIMFFAMAFGVYGALLAYLIGIGGSIEAIVGGSFLLYSGLTFLILSILVYTGLKAIEKFELFFGFLMLIFIFLIGIVSVKYINFANLFINNFSFSKILLPYGVIFFAFIGASAVPEMKETLTKNKEKLKKAIIIGSLIPVAVYFLFSLVVVGVTGLETTEISTIGLGRIIGSYMILFGNLFAIFSMTTSFLALGLALKWVYHYDYRIENIKSSLLTCVVPMLIFIGLYLLDRLSFLEVIGITGAVAGGIEGFMIVLIYKKAKEKSERKPEYSISKSNILNFIIMSLFVLGIVYQFF